MKRIIAVFLVLVLGMSVLSGCVRTEITPTLTNQDKVDGNLRQQTQAIKVGEHTLNAVDLNYFYVDEIATFQRDNYFYICYLIDTSKPLDEQYIDGENKTTWADYFLEKAQNTIRSTYSLYDEAVRNGYSLPIKEQETLETQVSSLEIYAKMYGCKNVNDYLACLYGNGATEESYRSYLEITALANSYATAHCNGLQFTENDLLEYQKEEPYIYNSYSFAQCYFTYTSFIEKEEQGENGSVSYTEEEREEGTKKAEQAANALAAGKYETVNDFDAAIKALTPNKSAIIRENVLFGNVNSTDSADSSKWILVEHVTEIVSSQGGGTEQAEQEYSLLQKWLIDPERREGDMFVLPKTHGSTVAGYLVVRFESCERNEFVMKNIRHIMVAFETTLYKGHSAVPCPTDEEKKAAEVKAERLMEQWREGNQTEASFAELATTKTADLNSKEKGGLYENVYPGQLLDAIGEWCYDSSRKVGDCEIVETEKGYHLVYFAGNSNKNYRNYMIEEDLRSLRQTQWEETLVNAMSFELLSKEYLLQVSSDNFGGSIHFDNNSAINFDNNNSAIYRIEIDANGNVIQSGMAGAYSIYKEKSSTGNGAPSIKIG